MRSQIQLGDVPSEAGTAIGEVLYAIVPKILTEPDSSIARWEKLGHGKELEAQAGSTPAQIAAGPRLTVHATDLNLQHATRYWIHIWSCDMASNCASGEPDFFIFRDARHSVCALIRGRVIC